ncbi:MAG: hypothetical protein ACR2NM_14705 [Bythopirellula sp.]
MQVRASWIVVALLSLAALSIGSFAATDGSATRQPGRARSAFASKSGSPAKLRLREGTLISDQSGFFREDGDGATFVADTGMEFGALPNLNLERVVRLLKSVEEPSNVRWSVSGTVTEFSGRNFLLISRAVYKAVSTPPPPDRIVE